MACLLIFFTEQIRITDLQCANEYKSHSKLKREIEKNNPQIVEGIRECFLSCPESRIPKYEDCVTHMTL